MSYWCLNRERKIYFKRESEKAIGDVTKIIFDFDGVLVYTWRSYRQTIRKVVDYYFLEILGLEGERGRLATLEDIQRFKDTGLYNNDWNLSYAIITYYLAILMRKLQQRRVFQDFAERFSEIRFSEVRSFVQTLGEVGEFCRRHEIGATELANMKNDGALGLESLLTRAKLENDVSPETTLAQILPEVESEKLVLVKKLVPYDLEKPDLLKRLFEESYLGEKLFSKFYGLPSIFNFNESFLEKEEFIPKRETLDALLLRFGKFAVYSEKPRDQGVYILEKNDFKEYFDEDGSVFCDDVVESEKAWRGKGVESLGLGKPNPTLFIKLIEKLTGGVDKVAYVGDGVADALLVENARLQGLSNILFLGVLCSSQRPDELFAQYVKYNTDAIMTDVNDIPYLYAGIGR
jgi:phosphoglycolate phosphatase-like HAD superfamily hydrolase